MQYNPFIPDQPSADTHGYNHQPPHPQLCLALWVYAHVETFFIATGAQAMLYLDGFMPPDGPDADGWELPNYIACPEGPDNPWYKECRWDGWCYSCKTYVSVHGKQDHDALYDYTTGVGEWKGWYWKWHCKPCWGVWELQQQTWKLEQQTWKLEQDLIYVASVPVPGLYEPDPDLE